MPHQDSPVGAHFELVTELAGHTQRVVVTELGASLRALEIDGVGLVQDYPAELPEPMSAGAVLVPWPNRVAGARWELEGVLQRLPVNEPARGHAIHGLLRNSRYTLAERTENTIVLSATLRAQAGYPFDLSTRVEYELVADGLRVRHMLENIGARRAPVAVGTHPYLRVGDVPAAELTLLINADSHLVLDEVLIPTGEVAPVVGTNLDYRAGAVLGEIALDDVWTDVVREPDGGSVHYLQAPDGSRVELRMDAAFGFIQVYTTDHFPGPRGVVSAVALEPMTAPANAFNSGNGLHWIGPGESWSIEWGIGYRPSAEQDKTED
ncbi:aldose epimerase [Arthrobacter sp. MYb227]|uniref:aldose 1-epimerase family protein n=1 Tax=Arthrobacter sp. MYb227 TaxID=1848601 RepID=UPI000CFC34C1|nr:aldose 1-epimerase family protein [Arthrobacter sp. MYb227]PQZ95753.1 aldose epimerase [Arthrobacter sp. MYb227]